jgi:hypothetical protein
MYSLVCDVFAEAAEQDLVSLSLAQSAADESAQTVRTVAANGQPRKVLPAQVGSVPSATAEASISAQPSLLGDAQREIRRTAFNGQPRKGFSLSRPADSQAQVRNTMFRNR